MKVSPYDPIKGKVVLFRGQPYVIKYLIDEGDRRVIFNPSDHTDYFAIDSDTPDLTDFIPLTYFYRESIITGEKTKYLNDPLEFFKYNRIK
jgi:hypothetical protein